MSSIQDDSSSSTPITTAAFAPHADDHLAAAPSSTPETVGRRVGEVWSHFTTKKDAHKTANGKKSLCKNCNIEVFHHNKAERVKTHLFKCKEFKSLMAGLQVRDQPEWYNEEGDSKKRKTSIPSVTGSSITSSSFPTDMRNFAIPKLTKKEQEKIDELVAMHFYLTGTSFLQITNPYLLEAFCVCHGDCKLPNRN